MGKKAEYGYRLGMVLLLFGLVAGCGPQTETLHPPEGPQALLDEWVGMWNSYDLNQVGQLFLNDHRLTYFSSEREGVIRGMEALVEHHEGFGFVPGGDERESKLWLEELETDVFGDAAVATAIWFFQSDPSAPQDPQRGPVTFVCLWTDLGWRFTHMNFSAYLPAEGA
jgi:ketosteroid isomerase-like protein